MADTTLGFQNFESPTNILNPVDKDIENDKLRSFTSR